MGTRHPRYSKEEFAQRGQAIYEQKVRPQVEEGNRGRIVVIDIETGEFEVADDPLAASDQLFARCPDAQPWLTRIGHPAVHRFGWSQAGGRYDVGKDQDISVISDIGFSTEEGTIDAKL